MQLLFKIIILTILILLTLAILTFLRYRIPSGKAFTLEREMVFQMIDIGQGDPVRANTLELTLGKRRIFTTTKNGTQEWFYVSKEDFDKCWNSKPADLSNSSETLLLHIATKKLLFGGYAPATIVKIETLDKVPIIRK